MITKERLEELKKENDFVFYILNNTVQVIRVDENYIISADEKINNGEPTLFHKHNNVLQDICEMKKVFEKDMDAQWTIDMTRTRSETLSLPIYPEFVKSSNKYIGFYGKAPQCYYSMFIMDDRIKLFDNDCQRYICDYELNFDNYKKVCEKALLLFEDEEINIINI